MADSLPSGSPASMPTRTRRTRIVCISDTHNCSVKLPQGDVLIHAGDLTNQGSYSELSKTVQWLEKAKFEVKIVVAGNHDITLDKHFYAEHGQYFHNSNPQDPDKCITLLKETPGITYLCHEPATIRLTDANGPRTFFTVFGSPFSPREGMWAFGYGDDEEGSTQARQLKTTLANQGGSGASRLGRTASELWSQIPFDTDILVTHTPPYTHCDESASRHRAAGCEVLRQTLWRVRPKLHVCGHVHEARGAERVKWEIDGAPGAANVAYAEARVECWQDPSPDPNSTKISLVDLTTRNGNEALDNHGSRLGGPHHSMSTPFPDTEPSRPDTTKPLSRVEESCHGCISRPRPRFADKADQTPHRGKGHGEGAEMLDAAPIHRDQVDSYPRNIWQHPNMNQVSGTFGLGGDPKVSSRCDRQALLGRMGLRETCIVNSAVMATSWPHTGGKKFNKPIVVDLDLSLWSQVEEDT